MSNLEHLFENAIAAVETNKEYTEWVKSEETLNIRRAHAFGNAILGDGYMINLRDIWTLANYVVYTHDQYKGD